MRRAVGDTHPEAEYDKGEPGCDVVDGRSEHGQHPSAGHHRQADAEQLAQPCDRRDEEVRNTTDAIDQTKRRKRETGDEMSEEHPFRRVSVRAQRLCRPAAARFRRASRWSP